MKRLIICLLSILFLCGCSAKADLVITSNHRMEEKIQIWNDLSYYVPSSAADVIASYKNTYHKTFEDSNYSISYSSDENSVWANIESSHNKLDNFRDSLVFQQLFRDLKIEEFENEKKYTLVYTEEALSFFQDTLGIGAESGLFFDEISLSIQFHNVVSDTNCDSYDEKTNTYYWSITEDNLNRNIEFTITDTKRYDIIIPYLLKKYLFLIILGIIIGVFVVTGLIIFYKSKKANEL